jgi:hypothetical protein
MKKVLSILVLALICSTSMFAQSDKEVIDIYQSIFGLEKKVIVADFLKLEENDPFWSIYDSYETERKELGHKRIKIIREYMENYTTLSEEKVTSIVNQSIEQKKKLDELIVRYYRKIYNTSGAKTAAQFYQIENFFLSATRMEVSSTLPFIVNINKD